MSGTKLSYLRRPWFRGMSVLLVFLLAGCIPIPYIVYEPGTAEPTRPLVSVGQPLGEETGELLLTTVKTTYANVWKLAVSRFNPNAELYRRDDILRGATRSEYAARLQALMGASQQNAVAAAYEALDILYEERNSEAVVISVQPGSDAEGTLQPGDAIVAVDGRPLSSELGVAELIGQRGAGSEVTVAYRRENREREAEIVLQSLPDTDPPRAGIGITFAPVVTVESLDPAKQAKVTVSHIGGPSAGLMLALEIVNQLTEADITQGYTIAGTGTISPDGTVGKIGGVVHKVVAAEREGAALFLTPAANAEAAARKAKEIGSSMRIVSVKTLEDALRYLSELPPPSTPPSM